MQKNIGGLEVSEEIGRAIRLAREALGLSQTELGKRVGVTRSAVSQWEKGLTVPSRDRALVVAQTLNLPLSLFAGDPSWSNVEAAPQPTDFRWVPIIDWVCAGKGASAVDPYPVGQGVDYKQVSGVSELAFILIVRGSSMEPKFHEGDTLVVDPAKDPLPNQYVIAELLPEGTPEGHGSVIFRQYKPRGPQFDGHRVFDLVPLNPEESTITVNRANPGRVIGVVVEHRETLA